MASPFEEVSQEADRAAPSGPAQVRDARATEYYAPEDSDWGLDPRFEERWERLHREIDNLYAQVQIDVGISRQLTEECLELLSQARSLLIPAHPENLPQAELNVERARARLKRARESDALAGSQGARALVWEGLWFVIFVVALLNAGRLVERFQLGGAAGGAEATVLVSALAWGGIGGAVAGFYSLPWHISRREYDGQYNLFYYVQPSMGMALGGMTFLMLNAIFTALLGQPLAITPADVGGTRLSLIPYLMYLLAWLAGFKQEFVYDLLDRVLSAILSARSRPGPSQ
jgi:hypothetical protein